MRSADITRRVALRRTLDGRLWRPFFIGLALLGAAFVATAGIASEVKHVVIVSVDGLRPDAISARTTPELAKRLQRAVYSLSAQTVSPSRTLPAHASMLTGLDVPRHGVHWNHYLPGHYAGDTVFTLAQKAGRTTAMLHTKSKLAYLAPAAGVDFAHGPAMGAQPTAAVELIRAFERAWTEHGYGVSFIHIREPDDAGHEHGWMSAPYLQAVAEVDRALGGFLDTLERGQRHLATAVIITADHGGHDHNHGSAAPEDMTIPWIALVPGHPTPRRIERPVNTYDTAPTVLALLSIRPPPDLDGRVVHEALLP